MNKVVKIILVLTLLVSITACNKQEKELSIHVISDIHYAPKEYYVYKGKFAQNSETNGSGKQVEYQEEIVDAYINQEIENLPDYILITGDLVFSGANKVHENFVNKFHKLIDKGIKVLVLPGNHDLDQSPYTYNGEYYQFSEQITKEDFMNIYQDFGYKDALSKDEESLSYSYKLNKTTLLIAIDTISKYGLAVGEIKDSTLSWIKEQLIYAKKNKMDVLAAGHHNLYIHNDMFDYGYRINNANKLINLFKEYDVHLYLSGHMHIQDIAKHNTIDEILTEAFALYPHRYGELLIKDHKYSYQACETDVENYTALNDGNLKNYKRFGYNFIYNNFYAQLLNNNIDYLDDNNGLKDLLKYLAELNVEYFLGQEANQNIIEEIENFKHKELISGYVNNIIKYMSKNNYSIAGSLK